MNGNGQFTIEFFQFIFLQWILKIDDEDIGLLFVITKMDEVILSTLLSNLFFVIGNWTVLKLLNPNLKLIFVFYPKAKISKLCPYYHCIHLSMSITYSSHPKFQIQHATYFSSILQAYYLLFLKIHIFLSY